MTAAVIDLTSERKRREKLTIALADAVHETMHGSPEDPTPLQVYLSEILQDARTWSQEDTDFNYRSAVALRITPPGGEIYLDRINPEPHHREVLQWAVEFLTRTQTDFGVRLLEGGLAR